MIGKIMTMNPRFIKFVKIFLRLKHLCQHQTTLVATFQIVSPYSKCLNSP